MIQKILPQGMRVLNVVLALLALPSILTAQYFQEDDKYIVIQDLLSLSDDAIQMEIIPPLCDDTTVIFQMPKMIPGTYRIHNYGLFVRDLKAYNAQGDSLSIARLGINSWEIKGAQDLYRISYRVEDTYGSEDGRHIFSPSGSCNDAEVFLLNQFAYVGYLEGKEDLEFELRIKHAPEFYGSGAWPAERSDSLDLFEFPNYFTLHDNPMLYTEPDTSSVWIEGSKVELSVYSPNKLVSAAKTMEVVEEVLRASAVYLGGELPVDKYSILVYCEEDVMGDFSYGALEHHRSTVLYMPEMEDDFFYTGVRDIVAHEFLHIITPLRIHSEQIHHFDFARPEMSRHLWLYEGVTEYNSHLVQVRDSIYSSEQFLEVMRDKFLSNDQFDDIPLTTASRYTLDPYREFYQNFYEGGAIAAMALDLYLIEISNGGMRLMDLLNNLSAVFPADTFFKDEDLFEIMGQLSFPQVTTFMVRHFEAGEAFPWERLLGNVGISYEELGTTKGWSLGFEDLSYDLEQDRFIISTNGNIDEFGEDLGLRPLDQIVSINGDTLGLFNFQEVLSSYQDDLQLGDEVVMVIARPKGEKFKIKRLKAEAIEVEYEESHQLLFNPNPEARMLDLRRVWLNQE